MSYDELFVINLKRLLIKKKLFLIFYLSISYRSQMKKTSISVRFDPD